MDLSRTLARRRLLIVAGVVAGLGGITVMLKIFAAEAEWTVEFWMFDGEFSVEAGYSQGDVGCHVDIDAGSRHVGGAWAGGNFDGSPVRWDCEPFFESYSRSFLISAPAALWILALMLTVLLVGKLGKVIQRLRKSPHPESNDPGDRDAEIPLARES